MMSPKFTPCGRTRREMLWEAGGGFVGTALTFLLARDGFFGQTAQAAVIAALQTKRGPLRTRDVRERINRNRQEPLVNERVYQALVTLHQRGLVMRLKSLETHKQPLLSKFGSLSRIADFVQPVVEDVVGGAEP